MWIVLRTFRASTKWTTQSANLFVSSAEGRRLWASGCTATFCYSSVCLRRRRWRNNGSTNWRQVRAISPRSTICARLSNDTTASGRSTSGRTSSGRPSVFSLDARRPSALTSKTTRCSSDGNGWSSRAPIQAVAWTWSRSPLPARRSPNWTPSLSPSRRRRSRWGRRRGNPSGLRMPSAGQIWAASRASPSIP